MSKTQCFKLHRINESTDSPDNSKILLHVVKLVRLPMRNDEYIHFLLVKKSCKFFETCSVSPSGLRIALGENGDAAPSN